MSSAGETATDTGNVGGSSAGMREEGAGNSDSLERTATNEYHGRLESADLSKFKIKRDSDGKIVKVGKNVVAEGTAGGGGDTFEHNTPVNFTTSSDESKILSLKKRAGNENSTSETTAKEADEATKRA